MPFAPGIERYRVKGGGSTWVALSAGDQITIIDLEGRQRCELTAFDVHGEACLGVLCASATCTTSALVDLATSLDDEAPAVVEALRRRGIRPHQAPACALFDDQSPSGAGETFTAQEEVLCVVAAPGAAMQVDGQNPPTDLQVIVRRAVVTSPVERLPPPLADPVLDFRIGKATAEAYEVQAGQYIQIIDVSGRQCSDFLAFHQGRLARGVEKGLDATTTRTLNGSAYPQPGLYAKFFDEDMRPLVEVVRDTVGRHDTFALACTARYYAEKGYPGHANCTDNFNAALGAYGVAPRRGWPAINFFYNTAFDRQNVLTLDEPWSRPGDYVLLRALTDLVCASSACPDDIDPANGWNPTDIHVRVYAGTKHISRGIAYRMNPEDEGVLTRPTAFHERTSALTRRFVEYRGYWLPASFAAHGPTEEYVACRQQAVVMDLSPLRKFEVLGPDAEALVQRAVTRDVRKLGVGQVVYTAICYPTGGMIDDATIFRLGANNFRLICGQDYAGTWLRERAGEWGLRAWVKSSTDQLHNLAVQGPRSRDILGRLVWTPPSQARLDEIKWFRFTIGRVGDHEGPPILVSRTGYSGELGYEVWCHPQDALAVWDAIDEAGRPEGLVPLGLEALDILRIEAGLVFAGYEFDDQVDPFEAGIGFTVALDKQDDFVGRAALQDRRDHPQRALVGLELAGDEPAAHGDCVHVGRSQVGVITSATRSPLLRKNIALARLAVQYAALDTEVEVGKLDGYQKRIPAKVVRFPFYDPEKKRPRS